MGALELALLVLLLITTLITVASMFSSLAKADHAVDFVPGVLLMQGMGGVWQYKASFFVLALIVQIPVIVHAVLTRPMTIIEPLAGRMRVDYPDEAMVAAVIYACASLFLMQSALAPACLEALRGGRPTFWEVVGRGVYRLVRLAPVATVVFLLVALPVFLCAVLASAMHAPVLIAVGALLGLWYLSALALTIPVAYDEGVGLMPAIKRSFQLTAGCRFRLALILLASLMAPTLIVSVSAHLLEGAYAHVPGAIPGIQIGSVGAAAALSGTIYATTICVVYETILRARGESEPPVARVFA